VTNARRVRNAFVRQGDIEARFIPNLMMGLVYAGGLFHALILFRAGCNQYWRCGGVLRLASHVGISDLCIGRSVYANVIGRFWCASHIGSNQP